MANYSTQWPATPTDEVCERHGTVLVGRCFQTRDGLSHFSHPSCERCEEERDRNERRKQRANELHSRIALHIPPKFRAARLCHIQGKLRSCLLNCDPKVGCILYGPPGRGKSYALCALLRSILMRAPRSVHDSRAAFNVNGRVIRTTWDRVLLDVRSIFVKGASESEQRIMEKYSQARYLFIEDLGATVALNQQESDFSTRVFTMILDWRIEQNLPTYISTNKTQANINRSFDDRIASRLELFQWIGVGGPDKRSVKHGSQ